MFRMRAKTVVAVATAMALGAAGVTLPAAFALYASLMPQIYGQDLANANGEFKRAAGMTGGYPADALAMQEKLDRVSAAAKPSAPSQEVPLAEARQRAQLPAAGPGNLYGSHLILARPGPVPC